MKIHVVSLSPEDAETLGNLRRQLEALNHETQCVIDEMETVGDACAQRDQVQHLSKTNDLPDDRFLIDGLSDDGKFLVYREMEESDIRDVFEEAEE